MSVLVAAERAVVGAAILDSRVLRLVDLEPGEFFDPRCRFTWEALRGLSDSDRPVDPVAVAEALAGRLSAVGGLLGITEMVHEACAPSAAQARAETIRAHATTRELKAGIAALKDLEGDELLERLQALGSTTARRQRGRARPIGEWVGEAFRDMQRAADEGNRPGWYGRGLSTGLPPLDKVLGGIKLGVLTVLAGRPSHGKSSLARGIADHLSREGVGVHVFSLEDSGAAYARRALAFESGVNLAKFSTAKGWEAGELRQVQDAASRLWNRQGWLIEDVSGLSARDIAIQVRLQKDENKTQLVIVDYVGHMSAPDAKQGDETARITAATKGLFHLARTEGVAVLMLSQLSRKCEERSDKTPMLSDLRQSGEIEQDAECVMFCHRQALYEADPTKAHDLADKAEVIVRKNKNGLVGTASLAWDGATTTYRAPKKGNSWG